MTSPMNRRRRTGWTIGGALILFSACFVIPFVSLAKTVESVARLFARLDDHWVGRDPAEYSSRESQN